MQSKDEVMLFIQPIKTLRTYSKLLLRDLNAKMDDFISTIICNWCNGKTSAR